MQSGDTAAPEAETATASLLSAFFVYADSPGPIGRDQTETSMPKQKTRKSCAKRFKQTGSGKFRRNRANGRHILTKKSAKRKRRLKQGAAVHKSDVNRIRGALPYGL